MINKSQLISQNQELTVERDDALRQLKLAEDEGNVLLGERTQAERARDTALAELLLSRDGALAAYADVDRYAADANKREDENKALEGELIRLRETLRESQSHNIEKGDRIQALGCELQDLTEELAKATEQIDRQSIELQSYIEAEEGFEETIRAFHEITKRQREDSESADWWKALATRNGKIIAAIQDVLYEGDIEPDEQSELVDSLVVEHNDRIEAGTTFAIDPSAIFRITDDAA